MHLLSTTHPVQTTHDQSRGIPILASSLFRELIAHGYSPSHVIRLTSELLELLTASMRSAGAREQDCVATALHEELRESA